VTTLILGSGGMLGRALRTELPDALALGRADLDITDEAAVHRVLRAGVTLVLNAAADTKVDRAESEPGHVRVNGEAVGSLARRCAEIGARFVTVSTDYVFNGRGTRPYRETDAVDPVNAYGRGKRRGEELALASGADVLVVRTSWVYGAGGANFVDTILGAAEAGKRELTVVSDQSGRPTYAADLAAAIALLASRRTSGLVHFANSGEATWYELAREALRLAGFEDVLVRPCGTAQYPRPARRPAYSVLDTSLYESIAGRPRPWKAALLDYVEERSGFRSLFAAAGNGP
jgi:dTDP-4-dehydrorhamnose reductase